MNRYKENEKRNKTKLAILLLLISIILIIGFSLAYFSDYVTSSFSATAGTVKLKVNGVGSFDILIEKDPNGDDTDYVGNMLPSNILNWNPGDVTTIEWNVENDGNKSIYTRDTLFFAWDVVTDIPEENIVYIYPDTMSDNDIRDNIANNNANSAMLTANNKDITATNNTKGSVYQFLGDVLDGTGLGRETGDSTIASATSQKVRLKIAFSSTATNNYQNKPLYIKANVEALQYRNNPGITVNSSLWPTTTYVAYTYPTPEFMFDSSSGNITNFDQSRATANVDPYNVVIPSTINGNNVVSMDFASFAYKGLTRVTFPNTITEIGNYAFIGNNLTSLVIPDSVTTIWSNSFQDNQITSLTLGTNVEYIWQEAFKNNHLTNVNFNEGLRLIDYEAFLNNKLTSITLPNSLDMILERAFADNQLTTVTIPPNVRYIYEEAFMNNPLTKIIIKGKTSLSQFDELGTNWNNGCTNIVFEP